MRDDRSESAGADVSSITRRSFVIDGAAAALALGAGQALAAGKSEGTLKDVDGLPSTIEIDHVSLGTANLYVGAETLEKATGLGSYEGGWFPGSGIANRITPLGDDHYIEVEACIDAHAKDAPSRWFIDQTKDGDVFLGWCLRVTSREELERISKRLGQPVVEGTLRKRADGTMPIAIRTPDSFYAWSRGLPSFFYIHDFSTHPARYPAATANSAVGGGIAWMELGSTKEAMHDWLGVDPDALSLRFNGKAPGLYAMGVRVGDQVIEIRHRPISLP